MEVWSNWVTFGHVLPPGGRLGERRGLLGTWAWVRVHYSDNAGRDRNDKRYGRLIGCRENHGGLKPSRSLQHQERKT